MTWRKTALAITAVILFIPQGKKIKAESAAATGQNFYENKNLRCGNAIKKPNL